MGKESSIVRRWVKECLSVTGIFLMVIVLGASFAVQTYYYDGVKRHLQEIGDNVYKTYSVSDHVANHIKDYVDRIQKKESVGVAVTDSSGDVIFATEGAAEEFVNNDSLNYAVESPDSGSFRTVSLSTGERMMSYSVVIPDDNGKIKISFCFYEYLTGVDKKISFAILIIALSAFLLLASFVVPCLFFLKSIVVPVRELRSTAYRIAQGDYEARADRLYDDEVGELADSINHMAEEIESTDRMKNDFISSVSHELRTPLTAIKGWAETMSFDEPDKKTLSKGLSIIISESERLTSMVEELLDFSRIQNGRMILAMDKIDLVAELSEAVYMLKQRASKEDKHIIYEEPEILPPVLADKNRLRQVFINIIDNAIKYSPEHGVIEIEVVVSGETIQVIVKDSGCGIAEKDLPRIKEKFYKANKTVRGSGIGLAVADEIITMHRVSLDIKSK